MKTVHNAISYENHAVNSFWQVLYDTIDASQISMRITASAKLRHLHLGRGIFRSEIFTVAKNKEKWILNTNYKKREHLSIE